jgi:hypothetical protein
MDNFMLFVFDKSNATIQNKINAGCFPIILVVIFTG